MYSLNSKMYRNSLIILLFILVFVSCKSESYTEKGTPEYITEINEWHKGREERLKRGNGWLNLVGLHWLKEGANTFGSSEENDIVFPSKAPGKIGVITLQDSVITLTVNENVDLLVDSQAVKQAELLPDVSGSPTIMDYTSLRWYIIKRGERHGIRLRDLEAPLVKNFEGIEKFPVNEDWKVEAKFEPYDPPKRISIPNILGTMDEDYAPGRLVFTVDGNEYSLDPTTSGDGLFVVFADLTSGVETYGAGRFLYADGPGENNIVVLDFNKSYNPPCAFTKYATCPLPPKQNHLKVRITAGEKNFGKGH